MHRGSTLIYVGRALSGVQGDLYYVFRGIYEWCVTD